MGFITCFSFFVTFIILTQSLSLEHSLQDNDVIQDTENQIPAPAMNIVINILGKDAVSDMISQKPCAKEHAAEEKDAENDDKRSNPFLPLHHRLIKRSIAVENEAEAKFDKVEEGAEEDAVPRAQKIASDNIQKEKSQNSVMNMLSSLGDAQVIIGSFQAIAKPISLQSLTGLASNIPFLGDVIKYMNSLNLPSLSAESNRISSKLPPSEIPVSGALVIVLLLSRWLGVAPIYVTKRDGRWFVGHSVNRGLYGMTLVGTLVIINSAGLMIDLALPAQLKVRTKSWMDCLMWGLDVLSITTITSLGVYTGRRRVKQMLHAVNCIEKIDIDLRKNLSSKKLTILTLCSLISLVLLLLCNFVKVHLNTLSNGGDWRINCFYSSFHVMYFCSFLIEVNFILIASSVKTSLNNINNILQDLLNTVDLKTVSCVGYPYPSLNRLIDPFTFINNFTINVAKPVTPERLYTTIQKLSSHHGTLCDVMQTLNEATGPVLCVLVYSFFLHLLSSLYYLASHLDSSNSTTSSRLVQCGWCVFHSVNMLALVEPCHRTTHETKRTKQLLSQLMRGSTSSSSPLYKQLDMFYRQLMMSCTEYQPLGVCTLNRPLVATIVGGVITSLVIVLQFDILK